MTTIAVDLERRAIASDSCVNDGNTCFTSDKIFTAEDGTLIAIYGTMTDALLFVDWFKAGADRTKRPDYSATDMGAITLNDRGCFTWDITGVGIPMKSKFYATGSGGLIALCALECGKTIEESIALAIKLDPENCRLPIVCLAYVKQTVKRARKKPAKK